MSHRGRRAVLTLLALTAAGLSPSRPLRASAALEVWGVGPMVKVRPFDGRPAEDGAGPHLFAARNEFEPFQIVVRAGLGDVQGVDLEATDFRSAQGGRIAAEQVSLYREVFLDVKQASSIEGETGPWPDALIPKVDAYNHEKRNAFPFTVAAGRTQPFWVEIYVPQATPPGLYNGAVRVLSAGRAKVVVPVTLTVWSFALPSTSSLVTTFGVSGLSILKQHRGTYTSDDELVALTGLYTRAALRHRLSTHGGTMAPPPFTRDGDGVRIDWASYDREMAPLLDGTLFGPGDPLPGARATSVDLRTPSGVDDATRKAYWQAWKQHFDAKGWSSRLYHYLWDEPTAALFPQVAARGQAVRAADTGIRNLVTVAYDPRLADVVSIWTPIVNCIDEKPGRERFCPQPDVPKSVYETEGARGKSLWWYQSCGSHGCDIVGGRYFTGWPSYVVDAPPVAHRIMEWLTWKYRIQGELYYNTVEAFGPQADPWTNVLAHGGNGDGTLFYPGRPETIGGRSHIPIESLRLKLIREGLEDYEYFVLLAKAGRSAWVDERVAAIARRTYDWEKDPAKLQAVRREMGDALDRQAH